MLIAKYQGFELHQPTSGGKAGTDRNVTTSVQVRRDNMIVKQIRCPNDSHALQHAYGKAYTWCDAQAILIKKR
jgi:hypothetical protein